MAKFQLPTVAVNTDGWGPTDVPEDLKLVPFAPFTKTDKIGRASDWTRSEYQRNHAGRHHQGNNVFNFSMDNEDSNFHLVDSRPTRSKNFGQRRHQQMQNRRAADRDDYRSLNTKQDQQRNRQQQQRQRYWREQRPQMNYSPSVDIRPEWTVLEQIEFPLLSKLQLAVGEPEDVMQCGVLAYYDKRIDRVTPKTALPLAKTDRFFASPTASDDPILRKIAAERGARIFVTDSVITTLMCATRSVYSWDIVIKRVGDQLWFDKRPDCVLDKETVNETAPDGVPEDDTINGVHQLSLEATAIRQNFSQHCVDRSHTMDLGNPHPFASVDSVVLRVGSGTRRLYNETQSCALMQEASKDKLSSVGYRYRKWKLGEDVDVVVRCEVDGVFNRMGTDQLLSIRTFNQAITGAADVDWKRKLESQSAAVLAIEVKNNSNRVAKWTLSALLAGCDVMKVGFVTRASPKDNTNHMLLTTQMQKPRDLASQLNISLNNCWAILRSIADLAFKLNKENYVLMRDPNKQMLYLYDVPENAFAAQYDDELDDVNTDLPLAG